MAACFRAALWIFNFISKQFQNKLHKIQPIWNFGPENKNFVSVNNLVNIFKKKEKRIKTKNYKKNNKFQETKTLMLDSSKSKLYLGWKLKWSLSETVDKILDWNKEKNNLDIYNVCKLQIMQFLNKK